ncbi:hypothetical protein VNI00_017525 [Paramarasmius palmivorus]|uniref:Uncharacterized protein n=1 Tax=Paramarasmius palmivorus TaxID=297713 RepID=A0AAW0B5G3_9AGAR
MGPGSREDYVDSKVGGWNWDKYVGMGASLCKRYREATKDHQRFSSEHEGLTSNLPDTLVEEWSEMCLRWENAPHPKKDIPNPYRIREEFMSEEKALQELELEEENRLAKGGTHYHAVSSAGFIVMGLEMRNVQDDLLQRLKELKNDPTTRQKKKVEELRVSLGKLFNTYEQLMPIYMPGLVQYLEDIDQREDSSDVDPADIKIWLPSDIPAEDRHRVCHPNIAAVEARLEVARCHDALHGIRHTLRIKSRMTLFKNTNVRGQRESGKAREVINRVVNRVHFYANRYRACRFALLKLWGDGEWEKTLQPLKDEDLRAMRDPALVRIGPGRKGNEEEDTEEEEAEFTRLLGSKLKRWGDGVPTVHSQSHSLSSNSNPSKPSFFFPSDLIHPDRTAADHRTVHGTGETRKSHSWIWWAGGRLDLEDGADENNNDILRSEWCKSRSRLLRAKEEILLVKEEMRRTLAYLEWRAQEWERCADLQPMPSSATPEGKRAYAVAQAQMQWGLKARFSSMFQRVIGGTDAVESDEHESEDSADDIEGEDGDGDTLWSDIEEDEDFGEEGLFV